MVVVIIIMWKTIDLDIIFEKIISWKKWYIYIYMFDCVVIFFCVAAYYINMFVHHLHEMMNVK